MTRAAPTWIALCAILIASCASGGGGTDSGRPPPTGDGGGDTCAAGQTRCDGVCVDTSTSVAHCGGCNVACDALESCVGGVCSSPCPPGTPLLCGDRCVDPATDDAHCGACDVACGAVEACVSGSCETTCEAPLTQCDDACVDLATDAAHCGGCALPCLTGETCAGGECQDPCETGLVFCDSACIDPMTDAEHCGASGSCTGAEAGVACATGETCVAGVCDDSDPASCADALAMGRSTGDGVYQVDPDGLGGAAPFDVYCDMTTDGGGWTLTYKIASNVPSGTNPWWNMVMPGSGTALPTTTSAPIGAFEGPSLASRSAYTTTTGATEWRASTMRTGAVVFDVVSSYTSTTGQAMRCFAAGTCASADQDCSTSVTDGRVLVNTLGGPIAAGGTGYLCDVGWTDCSFCVDWSSVRTDASAGGSSDQAVRYVGDSSISLTDTYTLYWVR